MGLWLLPSVPVISTLGAIIDQRWKFLMCGVAIADQQTSVDPDSGFLISFTCSYSGIPAVADVATSARNLEFGAPSDLTPQLDGGSSPIRMGRSSISGRRKRRLPAERGISQGVSCGTSVGLGGVLLVRHSAWGNALPGEAWPRELSLNNGKWG